MWSGGAPISLGEIEEMVFAAIGKIEMQSLETLMNKCSPILDNSHTHKSRSQERRYLKISTLLNDGSQNSLGFFANSLQNKFKNMILRIAESGPGAHKK